VKSSVPPAAEICFRSAALFNQPGLKLFDSAVNCLRRSSSDREPWSLYVSIDPRFSAPRSTNAFRAIPGSHSKVLHAFTDEAIV